MMMRDPAAAGVVHGGDLAGARRLFPDAPQPFLDLSTGINPHAYPVPAFAPEIFTRLPGPDAHHGLRMAAAAAYGAPSAAHVTAAPGTSILIPRVMALRPRGRVAVLGPTYAEHARAARAAGHDVVETADIAELAGADIAVVVNPNNPDGRLLPRDTLLALRDGLRARGGLLVVDEAFMDALPEGPSLAPHVAEGGLVVLRSFGKFFGLAGVRLGFAVTDGDSAARLETELGPWPVSGPAIAAGETALRDTGWRDAMRARLAREAHELDDRLRAGGLDVLGGTPLFRLVRGPADLFQRLGRAGILVRRFPERPEVFRFGLPGRGSHGTLSRAIEDVRDAAGSCRA